MCARSIVNMIRDSRWVCCVHAVRINNTYSQLLYSLGPSTSLLSFFVRFSRANRGSIYSETYASRTHTNAYIHAIADFKQLTQTRNRMNTAKMTITIEIQCTTTIIAFDSATHITSRSMYIIVFVVVSSLFLFLFAALCLSSSFVHLSFPSLYV